MEPFSQKMIYYKRSPCWSASAFRDTRALIAGKVMLDMAATAPAAHIILTRHEAMPL